MTNKALTEERAQIVTSYRKCFSIWRLGGVNNLSGVSTKANETKPDPFSKLGPKMAPRNHCWQPSGAGKSGAAARRFDC